MKKMTDFGLKPVLRIRDGKPYITDNGNFIADLQLGAGFDINYVASKLTGMVGVLEHGLFLNTCKKIVIGTDNGAVVKENNLK